MSNALLWCLVIALAAVSACTTGVSGQKPPKSGDAIIDIVADGGLCPIKPNVSFGACTGSEYEPDSACVSEKGKITWRLVDQKNSAIPRTTFAVWFGTDDPIKEDTWFFPGDCPRAKDGSLKCQVKNGTSRGSNGYKYMVMVDPGCRALDPRIYINKTK